MKTRVAAGRSLSRASAPSRLRELRARAESAEEALHAIGRGAVDAFVVRDEHGGARVFMLAGAERPYRAFFETMSGGAAMLSAGGTILSCNDSLARMIGAPKERLIGSSLLDLVDRGDLEAARAALSASTPAVRQLRVLIVRASGERLPIDLKLSNTSHPDPFAIAAIANDLGARERMEEALRLAHARLRRFIDANIVGVVIADSAGRILEANDYYLRLTGCTREELERSEIDWRALTPPEWLAADERAIRELRERGTCTPYEKEYRRPDGTRVPVYLAGAMLPGPGDQIAAYVLDLSERRRVEEELRALNATLEERVRERTAELEGFAYSVSHDLRAPLRALSGFSQALQEDYGGKLDPRASRYLDRIGAASREMAQLIDGILGLSRLSRVEMRRGSVDLTRLAREIAAELAAAEPARDVCLTVADGLVAAGDETLLRVVLENLLGNAWKFTAKTAGAKIDVGCEDPGGERVYFVRDNGAGFDMAYADRLFAPFQRLHSQSEFPGTGIGLASVQRVIHRHGGRIWAEGKVGGGAIFRFILLVEDNPDDVELTIRAFKKNNIRNPIVVAHDGEEAIDYLFGTGAHEGRDPALVPQVVLLDLKLPKLDGFGVLRRIRADRRTRLIPVIVLTSSREESDIGNGYELGTHSYIQKPVDFEQFSEAVRQLGLYWLVLNEPPPLATPGT